MQGNRFIELHTHMFNGHYVPLEEILDHKFGLPWKIAIPRGGLLKACIGEAPSGSKGDRGWLDFSAAAGETDSLADSVLKTLLQRFSE